MANELETKIQKLSADYIYNETLCSLVLLVLSTADDLQGNGISPVLDVHKDISDIKNYIYSSLTNLENNLNDGSEKRSQELINALNHKKQLLYIYESFYSYYSQLSIISNLINDEAAIRKYKEQNVSSKNIDFAGFYSDIIDFINKFPANEQPSAISKIVKCIPLKMTKDKYFDIVKSSMYYTFNGHSEESIDFALNTFKFTCYPEKNEDYGKYFPEIAEYLEKAKKTDFSKLDDTQLDIEFSDFDNIFEIMNDIDEYFKLIFNDINSLIILYYANFTFDELVEEEFVISDLYHSACEFIKNPKGELASEIFTQRTYPLLEEYAELFIDKANSINKKEFKLLENIKDFENLDEETSKILASEGFIRSAYYSEINDEMFQFGGDMYSTPATKDFKEKKFNEFIDVLKECFSSLELKTRKSAMQVFLGSLPTAINIYDFLEFVRTAIETAPSFENKVLILDKVGMIFDENGFNYSEPQEHNHIHHDDCEHDHHHDGCDCGHRH